MSAYLTALALVALPALGNFVGELLAELVHVSQRTLNLALHAAAGIILAVIGLELMPEALATETPWVVVLAFMAGGGAFILLDQAVHTVQRRHGGGEGGGGPWAIYFGVTVDLFSDGLMIGTGATIGFGLGLLLALGQASADLPEGFATIAAFKRQGVPRRTRLLLAQPTRSIIAAAFAVPAFLGAIIGFWAVRGAPEIVKLSVLEFTAGILLTVVIEEIVPEAHEGDEARSAALFLVGGFALFTLVSAYFGS